MRKALLTTALLAGTALALPAQATTLTPADVGSSGTGTFTGGIGTTTIPAIHGTLSLTLDSIVAATNIWNFSYSVTNTTVSPWTASLSAFGFDTTPNLEGASSTGFFGNSVLNGNISSGIHLDFCATTGPTCSGGASGGLDPGQTGTGTFALDFAGPFSAASVITLTNYTDRYQEITCLIPSVCGNVNGQSGVGFGTDIVINPLAVPGPLVGAGLPGILLAMAGLFGLNLRRRKLEGEIV